MSESLDYSIPAIPTVYKGRRYRSRLEARWAAFFDLAGLTFEYEPVDLGDWSPDFRVECGRGKHLLIEVKPIKDFHRETAKKMTDGWRSLDRTGSKLLGGIVLVGAEPLWVGPHCDDLRCPPRVQIGWGCGIVSPDFEPSWFRTGIGARENLQWNIIPLDIPPEDLTFIPDLTSPRARAFNYTDTRRCRTYSKKLAERVMSYWVEAANMVQWKPCKGNGGKP